MNATPLQLVGALAFGILMGWHLYFVNRYRTDVKLGDLTSILGALGGAAVLALFPANTDLFAAYGIGLVVGFFAYLAVLVIFVSRSKRYDWDWFVDNRVRRSGSNGAGQEPAASGGRAMGDPPVRAPRTTPRTVGRTRAAAAGGLPVRAPRRPRRAAGKARAAAMGEPEQPTETR